MLIDFTKVSFVEIRDEDNTKTAAFCWYYYIDFIIEGQSRSKKFAIETDSALAKKQRDSLYELFLKNCPRLHMV
jgi:hypothetical protein